MASIRVLDQIQVSPPPNSVPDSTLPFTFFDVVWLHTGPVERLFFYPFTHSVEHFVSHLLPVLKSSLSLALQDFHFLAGRVKPSSLQPDLFEYSYSDGDSIPFLISESDADFDELSGDTPRDYAKLFDLIPRLPKSDDGSIPLTALQVTVFPDRGISIGIAIHHVACDDSSSIHFVKTWSSICKLGGGASSIAPPFYDRAVIADTNGLYSKTWSEMKQLAANAPPPPPPHTINIVKPASVIASFSLTREQIDELKRGVLAKAAEGAAAAPHCSAFVVACAFSWVCLIKAQRGYSDKETAHLLFSVECRGRLTPPVPGEYFGNCLRPCFVEASMDDLLKDDGVFPAALAIGRAIKRLEDGVLEGAEGWMQKIMSLIPSQPMSVGGSPRYKVYDVDFGLGKPKKVELMSIEKTPGTISLAESREEQGGIEIGLVLPRAEMDGFSSCFSDGLKIL
ncbi:anthocyanin 5-aromatic acyltransferase-like [Typha angustifolia]|uniref:anthocyanin 5-aromatic acyltransferase-like n=1 Tax=Typha angustifolia TaxID=59011 RepID=UPI003C2EE309